MTTTPSTNTFRQLATALLLATALICLWGIWSVPILGHNEARRMVVVQEMLNSGDWLLPTLNGQLYLAKPPLLYWLMAASCTMFHTQAEWAMRLPTSLMALLLIALVLHRGVRTVGHGPALCAVAILATSETFIEFARTAQIEMLLALTCTLSLFWFLDYLQQGKRLWLLLSYAALGAALLAKGPVALIFIIPPALVLGLINRDGTVLRGLVSIPGWATALAIALPWFLYIFLWHKGLMEHVINEDIADKVAGSGLGKSSPLYTYPLFLAGAFAPWVLMLFSRPRERLRSLWTENEQRFLLLAALLPVLIMSLVAEKHGKYLLPLFPSLALVLGVWCHGLFQEMQARHPGRATAWAVSAVSLLLAGHLIFQVVIAPRIYAHRFSALKPMAATITRLADTGPVYSHQEAAMQLVYYAGRPLPVKGSAEIQAMVNAQQSFLVVSANKHWPELAAMPLCLVQEFTPFLKQGRSARIVGSGDFCTSAATAATAGERP